MLFSSLIFIGLFLPGVLLIYYTLFKKSRLGQNVFLFFASIVFYAWGEPWFVLIMLLSIFSNWLFGIFAARFGRPAPSERFRNPIALKILIAIAVIFNLCILFMFKYLNFAVETINGALHTGIPVPGLELPIGISFFTFQAMSYVIDVSRANAPVQRNPLNVGLYIAFFPQLIAGPIVRFHTIAEQIQGRRETWDDFSEGTKRFIVGFAKKILIANNMALVADSTFSSSQIGHSPVLLAWLGALAYTLQIYFDFSGYSDMAIGLGRMFGFRFLENFNYPYISKSTSEFWRRWHMSLGQWFRDYVYFPLGGSRVDSKSRLVFNLFVVWSLTGIWHGANWTFLIWGLLYFVTITLEKLSGIEHKAAAQRFAPVVLRHILTLLLVIMGWVIFRAENIGSAFVYMGDMFGLHGNGLMNDKVIFTLHENVWFFAFGILFSTPIARNLGERMNNFIVESKTRAEKIASVEYKLLTGMLYIIAFLVCMSYLVKGSYNPFIYFNF